MNVSRRALFTLAVLDVALFVIAAAFDNNSASSADGVVWWVALLGLLVLIVLGLASLLGSRHSANDKSSSSTE